MGKKKAPHKDGKRAPPLGDEPWKRFPQVTEQLVQYYIRQNILSPGEIEPFLSALRSPLPATFRIRGPAGPASQAMKDRLEQHLLPAILDECAGVESYEPPFPVPWIPDGLVWQLPASRAAIRRLPHLQKLKSFLVLEAEAGQVSRQELVSMIPTLMLDIRPEHRVLDLCAAPGSKTAQLIEDLHSGDGSGYTSRPVGFVWANDANPKRCGILVRQTKRLHSPCSIVTCHDGQALPSLWNGDAGSGLGKVMFDRILCDVPCSGDGTFRKAIEMWRSWTSVKGNGVHHLQLLLATRCVSLLAENGVMVYSTCSMNPVEDEAVVAQLLRAHPTLELVESDSLPLLKHRRGLSRWSVFSHGRWWERGDWEGADEGARPRSTMEPPSDAEVASMHLDRCLRVLPHDQNTGGFFVAVLRRKGAPEVADEPQATQEVEKVWWNPVKQAGLDDATLASISDFFGINSEFPWINVISSDSSGATPKNLFLVSNGVSHLLSRDTKKLLKVVNAGLKIFSLDAFKQAGCSYRLCQDGISAVLPYMDRRRVVDIAWADVLALMADRAVRAPGEPSGEPPTKRMKEEEEHKSLPGAAWAPFSQLTPGVQEAISRLSLGCFVLVLPQAEIQAEARAHYVYDSLSFVAWRGATSVSLFVNKLDVKCWQARLS